MSIADRITGLRALGTPRVHYPIPIGDLTIIADYDDAGEGLLLTLPKGWEFIEEPEINGVPGYRHDGGYRSWSVFYGVEGEEDSHFLFTQNTEAELLFKAKEGATGRVETVSVELATLL